MARRSSRPNSPARCAYGADNMLLRRGVVVAHPQTRAEFCAFFAAHGASEMVTDHGGVVFVERNHVRAHADYYFGAEVAP